jgi:hypothetical protein
MRLTVVASVLFALPAIAADAPEADAAFTEVAQRLAAPAVLRGNFTQSREIALLETPLQSSGSFLLSDLGLYWRQDKPLASVMIADHSRLLQQVDDGPLQAIDVTKNPMVLTFSTSFLSIFNGSESELRDQFGVEFATGENDWSIQLTPATYPMSEAIETIILRGREYIEELTVTSRSSEKTVIRFSDLQTEPDQLTDNEIELYAQ